MDPFMVVPGRPVADYEVSVSMPVKSNHRRNRHAPLLHATEWMQAMYHHTNRYPLFKDEPEIIGEGGEDADQPSREVAKSLAPTSAEKRRGMIYTPQALRPGLSAGKCETSGAEFESFLKQLGCASAEEGELDLCEDGEVSPRDVSRPLFRKLANNGNEPMLTSEKTPDAVRHGASAERFCDPATIPTIVVSEPPANLPAEEAAEATLSSMQTSQGLPTLRTDGNRNSTSKLRIARKPLPCAGEQIVKALPTSPQVTKVVSAMTEIGRGAGFPRIDYGPVGKHSALRSHPPDEEERKHSIWLSEGWKLWKSRKLLNRGCDSKDDTGVSSSYDTTITAELEEERMEVKPLVSSDTTQPYPFLSLKPSGVPLPVRGSFNNLNRSHDQSRVSEVQTKQNLPLIPSLRPDGSVSTQEREQNFTCNVCLMRFTHQHELASHLLISHLSASTQKDIAVGDAVTPYEDDGQASSAADTAAPQEVLVDKAENFEILEFENVPTSDCMMELAGKAILNAPHRQLTVAGIDQWISTNYPSYGLVENEEQYWQMRVRRVLYSRKPFMKGEKVASGRGHYWRITPGMEFQFE